MKHLEKGWYKMKEIKKEIIVYVVGDKEFVDKKQAEEYEKKLEKELSYTYYTVKHSPDTTEGRGYCKVDKIASPKYYSLETVMQFCVQEYGMPLAFVQGVSPIPNWIINKGDKFETLEELKKFKDCAVKDGFGDYSKLVKKDVKYLDEFGRIDEDYVDIL